VKGIDGGGEGMSGRRAGIRSTPVTRPRESGPGPRSPALRQPR